MTILWTALGAVGALGAAITPYLIHRRQVVLRRRETKLTVLHQRLSREVAALRTALLTLVQLGQRLQALLDAGPASACELETLEMNELLHRVERTLEIQLVVPVTLRTLRRRIDLIYKNPYPKELLGVGGQPALVEHDEQLWTRVRGTIALATAQQNATYAAQESLERLLIELRQREKEASAKAVELEQG